MRPSIRILLLLALTVTVRYVNGYSVTVPASRWDTIPAEGVDMVEACNPKCTIFQGNSIYWLYREGQNWVIGGGPVGYGKLPPETVLKPDGTQQSRDIKFMPDLKIDSVKLGWWWSGTKDKPMNERPR